MTTFAVAASGICPGCGVRITVHGHEIPEQPELPELGAELGITTCLCGRDDVVLAVVGLLLEPWRAELELPDELGEDEDEDDLYLDEAEIDP